MSRRIDCIQLVCCNECINSMLQYNHAAAHHRPLRILNRVRKSVFNIWHVKRTHEDLHVQEAIMVYVCGVP